MTGPERLARALTVVAALATVSYPAWAHRAGAMAGAFVDEFTQLVPGPDRPDRDR